MTFMIGIFQFHCKSEHKKVKGNEIKGDMHKSDSAFTYLKRATIFKQFLNSFFDKVYRKSE